MKIYLGADHRGFDLKGKIKELLIAQGHAVEDCGNTVSDPKDDYPDFVRPVAEKVAADPENSRGIIFGYSGQGEAMVANRVKNVRAAVYVCGPDEVIILSRQHNNANVLSFGVGFVSEEDAKRLVLLWLGTEFSKDERHIRRLEKMEQA